MKSQTFILVVFALISTGLFMDEAEGADKKGKKSKEELEKMTCKQVYSFLISQSIDNFMTCSKKLQYATQKEAEEKSSCISKCIGMEQGVIEPDGTVTKERVEKFIVENIPPRYHKLISPVIEDCLLGPNAPKVDPTDETCKSYDPIINCISDKFGKADPKKLCDQYEKDFPAGK